jgi:Ribonuclease G/E
VTTTLLIAWSPGEVRGVLLADGSAVELRVERDSHESLVGVRFAGRVDRVVPTLGAAFVDIGLAAPAFLPMRRGGRSDLVEGAAILVVVNKDERATKPPEVKRLGGDALSRGEGAVPRRLDPPQVPVVRLIASFADVAIDAVVVNDADTMLAARVYLRAIRPDLAGRLELISGRDVFAEYGVADVFDHALTRQVSLENGALISIEHTAAGTMIDVDMARAAETRGSMDQAILATNLVAADAIGRQLRLRGISGAIIIDFIPMTKNEHRQQVRDRLASAVKDDPTPAELTGWTRLGHFELTRRRGRASLAEIMLEPSEPVASAMTITLEALARITFANARPGAIALHAGPAILSLLEGSLSASVAVAANRCGRRVMLERCPDAERNYLKIDGI